MNFAPNLTDGWGAGLVQGGNRSQGQTQKTADLVARYLRSQDPDGKSTAADLIQSTLPGNLQQGLTDSLAQLLGLAPAADAVGGVAGALGAGAAGAGGIASLY